MRIDNSSFADLNKDQQREPSFVVEIAFDSANTDLIYLTFDAVTGLSGYNVINGVLEKISGTTQKINPDKAVSTIGSMTFSAIDDTLTATQKTKLAGGDGLRGKRVRYYVGMQSLSWSDFVLAQTQMIESVDYKDGVYTFKCADIQRQMREDIFDLKKTALSASLVKDDTTVTVYNTAGFERVKHPASPSGLTDAPGLKVGYIKIEQNDQIEIIRYTGSTATTFTGCTRGVLGTKPLDIEVPSGTTADNAPKVEEYVYLELPAPMLAYALLTGSIYGETGEYLPDHWHLGISTDYVKTSDFTGVGLDWWDTSNADKGVPAVVKGQDKIDGKKFIEEQIFRMLGAFSPVYSTGELGLRRLSVISEKGGHVRLLDESNVTKYSELQHDMKAVINRIAISWNWVETRQAFTRTNILIDTDSVSQHGEADPLKLELRCLEGSRHSFTTLKERFDSLRDRYAGPPLKLNLTLTPDNNDLEVGDIVRVKLSNVMDYTGSDAGHSLDRNFEIQQITTDWVTGEVKVSLFGSSQKAGALTATQAGGEEGTALGSAFFTSTGTEINSTNFPGAVSSAGGITTISSNITLAGNADLTNAGAVFYCNEDLTINAGVTVTIQNNVQLRVNGFLQINGAIDGAGQGKTTGYGFIGYSISQPGCSIDSNLASSTSSVTLLSGNPSHASGSYARYVAPQITLTVDGSTIKGIPSDLSGQPGAAGREIYDRFTSSTVAAGGAGGAGGAGLMIFSQGADFGASGYIDVSGADGSAGATYANWTRTFHAGKGAGGAPGAVYFVFTDSAATIPGIDDTTLKCYYGSADASGYTTLVYPKDYDRTPTVSDLPSGAISFYRYATETNIYSQPLPDHTVNMQVACVPTPHYVTGLVAPVEDTPTLADDVVSFTLTEYTNTPPSQQGNISTIEVSVTAPSDPNYSHAFIQYKTALNAPWLDAGPASPEATYQVPSDGTTYYVRALSVSKSGIMSQTGPIDSITVIDVIGDPDTEAPTVMDFNTITVVCESGTSTFTGKDAKFSWTDTNKDKLHFLEYKIEIKDGSANLMRTERTKDAFYVYTYEKNKEDYEAYHASAGANRTITITVTVVGALDVTGGKYEGASGSVTVSNPAPAAVGSLTVSPGYGVIYVTGTNPDDLDFTRFAIYLSDTAGFTAGPTNLLGYADHLPITIASDVAGAALASGTTYYIRIESHDEFGAGGITTDYAALMAGVPAATEIPVNEVLTVDGRIIANASGDPYEVVMGPQTVDSRAALFNFKNTTTGTHYFALFEDGSVEINGKVTIGTGSSVPYSYVTSGPPANATYGATWGSNITGQPADSAILNSQQVWSQITGTGKPADYADVTSANTAADTAAVNGTASSTVASGAQKANAGLNASGFLTTAVLGSYLSSAYYSTGLNINASYMGYYNGSSWQTYMDNTGKFYLNGNASNYLSWDGSTLTVRGNIEATSVAASSSISAPTITGGTISGTSLSSATVTSGTFQTATSGKRVLIDGSTNTMSFKNASGVELIKMDDTGDELTGYLYVTPLSTKAGITTRYGKYGINAYANTIAVLGSCTAGVGVHGYTSTGKAVEGQGNSGVGGYFTSSSSYAVRGINSGGTNQAGGYFTGAGSNAGVAGESTTGRGVQGFSSTGYGGWFESTSTSAGTGVYAHGKTYGGQFDASHTAGIGVYGNGTAYGGYYSGGTYSLYLTGSIRLGSGAVYSFTGSHDALLLKTDSSPSVGDIVTVVSIVNKCSVDDMIPRVKTADSAESKAVYGVLSKSRDSLPEYYTNPEIDAIHVPGLRDLSETEYNTIASTYDIVGVNGVGEGQINVCDDNGNIEVGDFICTSATPGKGQLYTGSDMRVVVAKAMEPVDWSTEAETTKMIACIYMCS